MDRDGIGRESEKDRGCSTGNANEKREEDRTYSSAVITCTVSYSQRGDTRSIPIQRISCRVEWGQDRCSCRFGTRKSGCTGSSTLRRDVPDGWLGIYLCVHFHALRNAIAWIIYLAISITRYKLDRLLCRKHRNSLPY